MGQPKKQTSPRKTGLRRSHLVLELARKVNKTSPVKVYTTKRESGKKLVAEIAANKAAAANK
ncbi:hypothetical protein HG444_003340 [Candidatus Saccharibacteria bacterium]|jgi:hypothetical protein|nr:hypothetical protein [Candidatus Saccharibacteria bacterium]